MIVKRRRLADKTGCAPTGVVPALSTTVDPVTVAGSMGFEKSITIDESRATFVAFAAGMVAVTTGTACASVRLSAAISLSAASAAAPDALAPEGSIAATVVDAPARPATTNAPAVVVRNANGAVSVVTSASGCAPTPGALMRPVMKPRGCDGWRKANSPPPRTPSNVSDPRVVRTDTRADEIAPSPTIFRRRPPPLSVMTCATRIWALGTRPVGRGIESATGWPNEAPTRSIRTAPSSVWPSGTDAESWAALSGNRPTATSPGSAPGGTSRTLPTASVTLPPALPTIELSADGSSTVTSSRTVPSESC